MAVPAAAKPAEAAKPATKPAEAAKPSVKTSVKPSVKPSAEAAKSTGGVKSVTKSVTKSVANGWQQAGWQPAKTRKNKATKISRPAMNTIHEDKSSSSSPSPSAGVQASASGFGSGFALLPTSEEEDAQAAAEARRRAAQAEREAYERQHQAQMEVLRAQDQRREAEERSREAEERAREAERDRLTDQLEPLSRNQHIDTILRVALKHGGVVFGGFVRELYANVLTTNAEYPSCRQTDDIDVMVASIAQRAAIRNELHAMGYRVEVKGSASLDDGSRHHQFDAHKYTVEVRKSADSSTTRGFFWASRPLASFSIGLDLVTVHLPTPSMFDASSPSQGWGAGWANQQASAATAAAERAAESHCLTDAQGRLKVNNLPLDFTINALYIAAKPTDEPAKSHHIPVDWQRWANGSRGDAAAAADAAQARAETKDQHRANDDQNDQPEYIPTALLSAVLMVRNGMDPTLVTQHVTKRELHLVTKALPYDEWTNLDEQIRIRRRLAKFVERAWNEPKVLPNMMVRAYDPNVPLGRYEWCHVCDEQGEGTAQLGYRTGCCGQFLCWDCVARAYAEARHASSQITRRLRCPAGLVAGSGTRNCPFNLRSLSGGDWGRACVTNVRFWRDPHADPTTSPREQQFRKWRIEDDALEQELRRLQQSTAADADSSSSCAAADSCSSVVGESAASAAAAASASALHESHDDDDDDDSVLYDDDD